MSIRFHCWIAPLLWNSLAFADTNAISTLASPLPDATASVLRMLGALAFVLAVFLGGVWFVKRLPQMSRTRGRQPNLQIVESRSLAPRQSVHVVGYREQRFLVASSPTGVTMLSRLDNEAANDAEPAAPDSSSFAAALKQVVERQ